MNIFKRLKPQPEKKPSPLLLEMETVNANLEQIASILAAQKPPSVTINMGAQQQASGADFEAFEPFDNSGAEVSSDV